MKKELATSMVFDTPSSGRYAMGVQWPPKPIIHRPNSMVASYEQLMKEYKLQIAVLVASLPPIHEEDFERVKQSIYEDYIYKTLVVMRLKPIAWKDWAPKLMKPYNLTGLWVETHYIKGPICTSCKGKGEMRKDSKGPCKKCKGDGYSVIELLRLTPFIILS